MEEPPAGGLIGVTEAIAILDSLPVTPRTVRLPLDQCRGLRLAEDVRCDQSFPPFTKAVMDGYAVRAGDVTAGAVLKRVHTIAAGHAEPSVVRAGEAAAIMTGAPMPAGADAVVPVEQTTRVGYWVTFQSAARVGQSIAAIGSDRQIGDVIARRGDRIGPAVLGALAAVGQAQPLVMARPTVAVLPTGDELIAIDQVPSGAKIRNSNAAMLAGLLRSLGCDVIECPPCADEPTELRRQIELGLRHDALFVTGGMSMGERDFVPGLFDALGLHRHISKLRIKPGKPFVFASDGRRLAFGLPGNPVSAFLCTLRLASRVLTRLAGGTIPPSLPMRPLAEAMPANAAREFYQPATIAVDGSVCPLTWRGSADLFTLAQAEAFIVRPENAPAAPKGDAVFTLPIPD